jgi:Alr-MurF fusion protein
MAAVYMLTMDTLSISDFAGIIKGRVYTDLLTDSTFSTVTTDSRRVLKDSVFFPLKGTQADGHQFVAQALENGAIAAVVAQHWLPRLTTAPDQGRLIVVKDPLEALQALAAWWRGQLAGKVIGITGSNGKTVVKDTLVHLLSEVGLCSGSPGSFNSQLGVPLSVIRIPRAVEYAVLEAGASNIGEMTRLERIIRPDCGILTNVGYAHIAAFGSRKVIAQEKLKLFHHIHPEGWALVPALNLPVMEEALKGLSCEIHYFGRPSDALPFIKSQAAKKDGMVLSIQFPAGDLLELPVSTPSPEIVSDIEIAICAGHLLGIDVHTIQTSLSGYTPGSTRMEIWKSPLGFTLINDSCSSDPLSVRAALNTLASISQDAGKRVFVFGGMKELGQYENEEHTQVGLLAGQSQVDTLVLVGQDGVETTGETFRRVRPQSQVIRCKTLESVKAHLLSDLKYGDTVLVKGPRSMGIARLAREIVEAMAPNRFTVDLEAVGENITRFQRLIGPKTKILAMVKALAYGSDATKLSIAVQGMGVDYIGVASTDEGAALRKAGTDLPILVMMCTGEDVDKVVRYHLTPMIYSFDIVDPLARAAATHGKVLDAHIEIDTGLGRLGVMPAEAVDLAKRVTATGALRLTGIMTHFACADDPAKDEFTHGQIDLFKRASHALRDAGFAGLIRHACATAGAVRFPEARFDMVRIGIGMYGIYPSDAVAEGVELELAVSLLSRVVDIRTLNKGDRVGYGGTFEVPEDGFKVGVVPIGYHDGIPLIISNRGYVFINGRSASIIGRVSMDSMIVDLSKFPDVDRMVDVLIYGKYGSYVIRPEDVANLCDTIPYELLTRLGPRVQRIFIGEFNRP